MRGEDMGKCSVRIGALDRRAFIAGALKGAAGLMMAGTSSGAFGADTLRPLKLGNIAIVNFAPVYRFKAISKDYGFDVEFVNFPSGTERLNALAAGYIDGAGTGVTQPILLRSKGVPLRIVSGLSR